MLGHRSVRLSTTFRNLFIVANIKLETLKASLVFASQIICDPNILDSPTLLLEPLRAHFIGVHYTISI